MQFCAIHPGLYLTIDGVYSNAYTYADRAASNCSGIICKINIIFCADLNILRSTLDLFCIGSLLSDGRIFNRCIYFAVYVGHTDGTSYANQPASSVIELIIDLCMVVRLDSNLTILFGHVNICISYFRRRFAVFIEHAHAYAHANFTCTDRHAKRIHLRRVIRSHIERCSRNCRAVNLSSRLPFKERHAGCIGYSRTNSSCANASRKRRNALLCFSVYRKFICIHCIFQCITSITICSALAKNLCRHIA